MRIVGILRLGMIAVAAAAALAWPAAALAESSPGPGTVVFHCSGDNQGSADCPYGAEGFDSYDQTPSNDPFYDDFESMKTLVGFVFFLVITGAIVSAVLRYKTGARVAERAGLDPQDGGMTSLLSENGLPAAYMMGNLPGRHSNPVTSAPRTVEQRLGDLQSLLDKKLITQGEYDSRRAAILEDV